MHTCIYLCTTYIQVYIYICVCVCVHIYIYIYTNPSTRAGYDTRSIFKRSLTGLNSEFSFSETRCLTKAEEPSLSYYLHVAGWENNWIHAFPKGISAM